VDSRFRRNLTLLATQSNYIKRGHKRFNMVTNIRVHDILSEELIADCIAGRRKSQELLYAHFSPKMFGICLRYASDYHSAEDILQDGFIKAFNNLHRFRNEGSFEGWLKRIFVNTSIEHYRKNLQRRQITTIDHAESIEQVATTPLDNLAKDELLGLVQKLSPGYRTVFNLYAIEGFAHKEIGKLLDISEGTSKSQLARARINLQKMIKELRKDERQRAESHR